MSSAFARSLVAPIGSTGNNTHTSVRLHPAHEKVLLVLIVENGGASPAISWKVQGALDVDGVADGSASWFDLLLLPPNSDTVAAIPLVVSSATTGTVSRLCLRRRGEQRPWPVRPARESDHEREH